MSAVEQYLQKVGWVSGAVKGVKTVADGALDAVKAFGTGVTATVNPGTVGRLAGEAGVLAGAAGIGYGLTNAYYAATKDRDFNRMVGYDQELKQHHDQNPKQFRQLYNSFRSMNPQFASDPVVSAHFMRNMVNDPATAGQVIVQSLHGVPKTDPLVRMPGITAITPDPARSKQLQISQQELELKREQHGYRQQRDVVEDSRQQALHQYQKQIDQARQQFDKERFLHDRLTTDRQLSLQDRKFDFERGRAKDTKDHAERVLDFQQTQHADHLENQKQQQDSNTRRFIKSHALNVMKWRDQRDNNKSQRDKWIAQGYEQAAQDFNQGLYP